MSPPDLIPVEHVQSRILVLRGQRVIIDRDLARLYGVTTKRLNEQVKRNQRRFPEDFVFQLTKAEKTEVVAKCDHLGNLRFSNTLPYAFTEHGAIQAANVINSATAEKMGVMVVRTFIQLRQMMGSHKTLTAKLTEWMRAWANMTSKSPCWLKPFAISLYLEARFISGKSVLFALMPERPLSLTSNKSRT
ncbi:ORF6N domain-containing protein [Ereboglobus luteus]|uniref:ORF6N domain-containing protein n=1 Tax=Ereboglobus luteus TaxID=1796921 RepID=UPI001F257A4D|nr:ORF6N domain-containing protein [Ereboglobus luteus]